MNFNWVDYVIITVLTLSALAGLMRGFIKELLGLAVWILSFWVSYKYYVSSAHLLKPYIHEENLQLIVAFSGLMLICLVTGAIFNRIISYLLRNSGLGSTDRILGVSFGVTRGILIIALVMVVVNFATIDNIKFRQNSSLYALFNPAVNTLKPYVNVYLEKIKTFKLAEQSQSLNLDDIIASDQDNEENYQVPSPLRGEG